MAIQTGCHIGAAAGSRDPAGPEAIEQQLNRLPVLPMRGANPGRMLVAGVWQTVVGESAAHFGARRQDTPNPVTYRQNQP